MLRRRLLHRELRGRLHLLLAHPAFGPPPDWLRWGSRAFIDVTQEPTSAPSITLTVKKVWAKCGHGAIPNDFKEPNFRRNKGKLTPLPPCPGRDSNPDCDDFKSSASANWATGARKSNLSDSGLGAGGELLEYRARIGTS
jgi:hypothetical protein